MKGSTPENTQEAAEQTADLASYLAEQNKKTLAWVAEDPEHRFAGCYTEDIAHWNEMGIFTPADLIHYDLACNVYEQTKAVWGYKPSWKAVNEMTNEELEAESKSLSEAYLANLEQEKEWRRLQKIEDDYQAELAAHEATFHIEGELQFVNGCWAAA